MHDLATHRFAATRRALAYLNAAALALTACAGVTRDNAHAPRTVGHATATAHHPLDPLGEDETAVATDTLKREGKLADGIWLVMLALHAPRKSDVLAWKPDHALPREAFAVLYDRAANRTYEAIVDLSAQRVASHHWIPLAQPMFSGDAGLVARLVRKDPRFLAAMKKRDVTDLSKVYLDEWCPGDVLADESRLAGDVRLMRAIAFYRGSQQNAYGPPIEGVVATVDITHEKVLEVTDTGVVALSKSSTDFFDPNVIGPTRAVPKPLKIEQPEGPSFTIQGHEIVWQKWHFRYAMHPREGLVLYSIGYEDGGRVRSILYRASVSEMWIPYGDPDASWSWRNALDEGEYGLGQCSNTLVRGSDAPENAVMLEAPGPDDESDKDAGAPSPDRGSIAVYERDAGTLWSHAGGRGSSGVRRARELVIGFVSTIGNYDYGFKWIFHQDGVLEFQVDLTGIVLTKGVAAQSCQVCNAKPGADGVIEPRGDERYGTLVAERIVATNHQHFISLRLDFDVDGEKNSVQELSLRAASMEAENPAVNAFVQRRRILRSEGEAARDLDASEHRTWEVLNPAVSNALGHRTGYTLVPGANATPFAPLDAPQRKHAGFTAHQVWVTREHDAEMYAAGNYPSQSTSPDGLTEWILDDEPIENEDVVVWYTLGVTHVPRPEDFPVMPVAHAGFELVPSGFFARNPGLDVPGPR